jgi:hypothetical protein
MLETSSSRSGNFSSSPEEPLVVEHMDTCAASATADIFSPFLRLKNDHEVVGEDPTPFGRGSDNIKLNSISCSSGSDNLVRKGRERAREGIIMD